MTDTTEKTENASRVSGKTFNLILMAMFTAILAILAQVSIPLPSGVPITLQTFAVALTGAVLGWKRGTISTVVYVLLGLVGVPVFAGFSGGPQVFVGYTGGFIWGFIVLAALCGAGASMKNKVLGYAVGLAGLAVCHLLGIIQFMIVAKMSFVKSFLVASMPYLIKDALSVVLAYLLGAAIKKALIRSGLYR